MLCDDLEGWDGRRWEGGSPKRIYIHIYIYIYLQLIPVVV